MKKNSLFLSAGLCLLLSVQQPADAAAQVLQQAGFNEYFNYSTDKTLLNEKIVEAEAAYSETAVDADILETAINQAKAVSENSDAGTEEIVNALNNLSAILLEYQLTNASESSPLNMTSLISNPDFEDSFTGWNNNGMTLQTNTDFPYKTGKTYIEKWVTPRKKIPDVSINQTLTGIPNGIYRLTAAAGHIVQKSSGSSVNSGSPQTGAWLTGAYKNEPVDTVQEYTVEFVVVDNQAAIGLKAENATGNWLTCDNFRLAYVGKNTAESYTEFINAHITIGEELETQKMQHTARESLASAIGHARSVLAETSPAPESLDMASRQIVAAVNAARISGKAYIDLQAAIDEALYFQANVPMSESKASSLQTALTAANKMINNFDAALTAVNSAKYYLLRIIRKQLYTNSLGNVSDPEAQWSLSRKKESKHWVVFWESGYGSDPAAHADADYRIDIDALLNTADKVFDFHADSLKFIRRGASKTDDYKMIIRLRYTREWEASGSGVDNTIGLLTLTAWSAQAAGHTLAHEIGHCFQYQVHCDNGDQNGWMYGYGDNASGGNGWWEQCAQWQAFKFYPSQQFTDGRFTGYMNTVHKHILHEAPRYDNYFIQDYWTYRHGINIIARLWNESIRPEDPVETYKRITKVSQAEFNDEMWDCAARFATWDIPALKASGANYIQSRPQPKMNDAGNNYWLIDPSVCPENYGHNIIKLNSPSPRTEKQVSVYFEGKAGMDGYRKNKIEQAGWRYGFAALLKDGTRVYSSIGSASYTAPNDTLHFTIPAGCLNLWLVVSGAPKTHWRHAWDNDDSNDEQWPYQVKFNNTNLLGAANIVESSVNNAGEINIEIYTVGKNLFASRLPSGSVIRICSIDGSSVMETAADTFFSTTLPSGMYVVSVQSNNGSCKRKIMIK